MEVVDQENSVFEMKKRQSFLLLCFVTLVILFVKTMIENETAAFEFLADQPVGSFLYIRSAVQYLTIPLVYAWKFTVLGLVIWMGCFLFGYRVTFSQCWGIVVIGEFVFIIPELIKIIWFLFIQADTNFYDFQAFYPMSVINLVDYRDIAPEYKYPFKALSLFEVLYWYVLALGIKHFGKRGMKPAWTIVLSFYVPIFLLWLLFYITVY